MSSVVIQTRSAPVAERLDGYATGAINFAPAVDSTLTGDEDSDSEILDLDESAMQIANGTTPPALRIFKSLFPGYHLNRTMEYIDEGYRLLKYYGKNMPRKELKQLIDQHEQLSKTYYATKTHPPLDRTGCRQLKHRARRFVESSKRLSKDSQTTGLRKQFQLPSSHPNRTPTGIQQPQSDGGDQLDPIPESSAQTSADGSSHRGDDERCPGIGKSGAEVSSQVAGENRAEEDEKLLEQIAQRNF